MKDQFPIFRAFGRRISDLDAHKCFLRRLGRAFRRISIVAAVIIVFVLVIHAVLMVVWGRQLERRLDQLRASGAPAVPADLAARNIPVNQNGGLVYEKVMRLVGDDNMLPRSEWKKDCDVICEFLNTETGSSEQKQMLPSVKDVLNRRSDLFPALREAASRPQCRFTIQWKDSYDALFPQFAQIRNFTRLCTAQAQVDAINGDMNAAAKNIILALRVSQATKDEPILIASLVSYACLCAVMSDLSDIMRTRAFTQEQVSQITHELGRIELNSSLANTMEGERAGTAALFEIQRTDLPRFWDIIRGRSAEDDKRPLARPALLVLGYLWRPISFKDQQVTLDLWEERIELMKLPYREAADELKELDTNKHIPRYAVTTRMLLPAFSRTTSAKDIANARIGMAQTALALESHRAEFGSYPADLGQLGDRLDTKTMIDPFSGEQFIYKRLGNAFLLYSIGRNLKDDAGIPKGSYPHKDEKDDIVWGYKE